VGTANLFLAFYEKGDVAGIGSRHGPDRVQCRQPGDKLALVVFGTACEELSVTDGGLERRTLPQF